MCTKAFSILVVTAVLAISSKGFAAVNLECEGTGIDQLCLSLPPEAPESSVNPQPPIQEAVPTSLITEAELQGEAAEFTVLADGGLPSENGIERSNANERAISAVEIATERLKTVEIFLRNNGKSKDGIVIISND